MKIRTGVISAALVAAMMSPLAYADQQKHEQKFCNALEEFSVALSKYDGLGTSATVGEVRSAADRVSTDAAKVEKAAKKIKSSTAMGYGRGRSAAQGDAFARRRA